MFRVAGKFFCDGHHHHEYGGKTTTGPALDRSIFDCRIWHTIWADPASILRVCPFTWLGLFGQWYFGGFMVKLYFLCWNHSLSSGWHIVASRGFVSVLGFSEVILDSLCKLISFLQCSVNLLGHCRIWPFCVEEDATANQSISQSIN